MDALSEAAAAAQPENVPDSSVAEAAPSQQEAENTPMETNEEEEASVSSAPNTTAITNEANAVSTTTNAAPVDSTAPAAATEAEKASENAPQSSEATAAPLNADAEQTKQPTQPPTVSTEPPTPAVATPAEPPAPKKIEPLDPEDAKWHTVGIFSNLSTTVTNYIDNREWSSSAMELTADQLPDLAKFQRINLEPGTAYRFRLRAINSCGASDWSEVSNFKTCLPGFPGAPSAIKISKSSEGAHLTWEPPPTCQSSNEIVEYSVYLAVKPAKDKEKPTATGVSPQRMPAQLAFVRVYVGAANQCTVSHSSLAAAHVDCSNKPAIIFRIAARNEKGYGPATQVRWLQDPVQSAATAAAAAAAAAAASSILSPTRNNAGKSELGGASPSKRFKAGGGGGSSSAVTRMPSSAADN